MSVQQIGTQLCNLCREGKNLDALDQLYADNIVSVEAAVMPGTTSRVSEGIAAVRGKSEWWAENNEVHSASVEGPFPHGDDRFAVLFDYDVTFKPMGSRSRMREVAVYTVAEGKIVREEFFYASGS